MKTSKELAYAVKSYQDGDREAFAAVYEQSYRYLYACVMHIVKDEEAVQDMLQETYLEIAESARTLKDAQNFLNWAAVIANRKCFAYLKKNKNLPVEDMKGIFEEIPDDAALIPEELMQDKEKQRLIWEIIDGLSDMQRLCVIGYYYNEQSQESLAEEFGIPVGTVKSHLSRARAKIKLAVEELDVKKGTRLYNVAPFMFVLLEEEAKACMLKPMSAALTSIVGTKAAGKVYFPGKLKAAWAKLSAGLKAKIAVGGVAVCAAGVAAAVIFSGPKPEPPVISEETKQLFDRVLQICADGNYEELCLLDFSSVMQEELKAGAHNLIYYNDKNGEMISSKDENGKYDPWYYDGENCELLRNFTGHGLLVDRRFLAAGDFKNGQADGDVVSFNGSFLTAGGQEIPRALDGGYDTCMDVTELHIENGALIGEAVRRNYCTDTSGQPVLLQSIRGNAVPVRVLTGDIAKDVIFCFDGRVEYVNYYFDATIVKSSGQYERMFQPLQPPEEYAFYMKAACIDGERCQNVDGNWIDESGQPILGMRSYQPGQRISWFLLTVSESLFDLDSLQIIEMHEELETK